MEKERVESYIENRPMGVSTVLPSEGYTQHEAGYQSEARYDIIGDKQEVVSQDKQDVTSGEYPSDSGLMTSRNSSQNDSHSNEDVKKYQ